MTKARDLANIISGGFTADDIPNLDASKITSGSIADARIPATALNSNVDLTNLSASNLTSGTIPTARITALPAGVGGKVLQVVNATYNVEVNTTTNTFVNTGLNASITPTSASNKVLILVNQTGLRKVNTDTYVKLKLQRVTTDITNIDFDGGYNNSSSVYNSFGGTGICYLDTPNTTSSTNYKTVFNSGANSGITYVQVSGSVSSITLMEIEA